MTRGGARVGPAASSERPACLILATVGLTFSLCTPVASRAQSPSPWLPANFDSTVAGNYRGARIVSKAQLDSMQRRYGIRTVINLAKDALPASGPSEIDWTRECGIEYVRVYLGTKPPTDAQWRMIKEKLAAGGVYLHCAHGADRTGAIVGRYRTEVEGVPFERAWKEARRYGFKPWLKDLKAWIEAGVIQRK